MRLPESRCNGARSDHKVSANISSTTASSGGGDEELERARAADALEVELRAHHVTERVEVLKR